MNQPRIQLITMLLAAILLPAIASAATPLPNDGKKHTFTLHDGNFYLDDQPMRVMAGEMHPARIPAEFWEDRIKKARAMGLNTVSVYIFWNQLEPQEGVFDFTGMNDVRRFVKLCQDNGMWVFLRPGPYVCAEAEFGGYPAWLLKHKDMKVRTNDPQFMAYQRTFMQKVHDQLGDLQITHGGPIVMVQIENELSEINDFLAGLKDIFTQVGFDTQLATCDHHVDIWHKIDGLPNVLRGYNGLVPTDNDHPELAEARRQAGSDAADQKLKDLAAVCGPQGYPLFTPESYTAWFSSWGARVAKKTVAQQVRDAQWLVDHPNVSFSYYVFDGGTNFGFNNGANRFAPVATTYDYDAPVNELGQVTPKFKALRQLFIEKLHTTPTEIPSDPKVIEIPPFQLAAGPSLVATLSKPTTTSDNVLSMEDVDQSFGLIDYRKKFDTGVSGTLDIGPEAGKKFPRAMDYAIVMLDGKVVGEAFDGYDAKHQDVFTAKNYQIKLNHTGPCTLDILVYNLGRNSVGITQEISRKGLIADPSLDGKDLKGWDIYSLPMNPPEVPASAQKQGDGPVYYTGTFNLKEVGETYLDLRNFSFGAVWVNGHNLGRYWDVGADRGLYLPSVWEKAGDNQITVIELGTPPKTPQIKGMDKLIEEPAKPFAPYHQL